MTIARTRSVNLVALLAGLLALSLTTAMPALARVPSHPAVTMVMELDAPLEPGEWAWDMGGANAGDPTWVVIDIAQQQLYVYRGGVEIGRSTLIYGADDTPTPFGTFPVLSKVADKRSRSYNNAPMPWSIQLTKSWVAIHGAEQMEPIYATHGCIGVPTEFARTLFAHIKVGDRVTITRNWKLDLYASR